jgi:hypothetical protein
MKVSFPAPSQGDGFFADWTRAPGDEDVHSGSPW